MPASNESWRAEDNLNKAKSNLASKLEELEKLVEERSQALITCFTGDEPPVFRQGPPKHELEEYATAEWCNWAIIEIMKLRKACQAAVSQGQHADGCKWWDTPVKDMDNPAAIERATKACDCYLKQCRNALAGSPSPVASAPIPVSATIPFAVARHVMGDELSKDEGLRAGYRANLAMLLHDRYGIRDYKLRTQAAEDIIGLLFDTLPTTPPPQPDGNIAVKEPGDTAEWKPGWRPPEQVPIPCPDGKKDCLVSHTKPAPCAGCGNPIPERVGACPRCASQKCDKCDMGDDVGCSVCEGPDEDDPADRSPYE